MCDQQSDQSLCLTLKYSMNVKPLIEHHLEFLSLKGGCTGSPESYLVKIPHCWKSHVTADTAILHISLQTALKYESPVVPFLISNF